MKAVEMILFKPYIPSISEACDSAILVSPGAMSMVIWLSTVL